MCLLLGCGTPGVAATAAGAQGIAITPKCKTTYVAQGNGTVTPMSTATNTAGTPIRVDGPPYAIAMTP